MGIEATHRRRLPDVRNCNCFSLDKLAENRVGAVDFRHFFAAIHKEATPIGAERTFYSHVTSVTNPRSMRSILEIRECRPPWP